MNARIKQVLTIGAVAAALLTAGLGALSARAEADEAPTRSETVALGGATSARVEVELAAGRLWLAGGSLAGAGTPMPSDQLLRGDFTYDHDDYEPKITYTVDGDVGRLELEQKGGDGITWPWDDAHNAWDLYLNPTVPTDLSVEVGAGDSELALGGLSLTGLAVTTGAGETTLDFVGDWRSSLEAEIENGAGELTLSLPRDVGVRVAIDQGAGDVDADGLAEAEDGVYVNDAYGTAPVTLDLAVHHGAGDVVLEQVG